MKTITDMVQQPPGSSPDRKAAALLERVDWTHHPMGPPEQWPLALKTMLAMIMASSEAMYLVWGPDRTFFFNDAYVPVLGSRVDGAMGSRFEMLWAATYALIEKEFEDALEGRSTRVVDLPVPLARWGAPEDTWWTFSYTPVFGDDGAIAGVLCITSETTASVRHAENVRLAAALADTERSLQRAQQAGRVGVFTIDIETGTLTGSDEFFKLFGLPATGTTDAGVIERMTLPEDAAIISNARTRASPDLVLNVEYRVRRPDTGAVRCIERRAEVEHDAAGKPVRLLGVVQDVTERRNDRDALARHNATLAATVDERTRALLLHEHIIQSDTTPICAFDTDYRLIAFNKAHNDEFYRVNGFYTRIGDVFCDLFVPEQRPVMRALMTRALTGETFSIEEDFGNPAIDAPRWEIHYSALRDEAGKVIGAFHHARDVSARQRAQAELDLAQEALRQSQKMEAMGQLTGGVAHDFNNLLTPIIGSLDMLQRKHAFAAREARLVQGAMQSAERAKTLVQRLLAFARRQPLQTGPVDLSALVGGMAELLASTSGPQIAVQVDIPPHLPPALADAHQLEMAILNLCVNARDAMPGGGGITIAARREPVQATAAGHGFLRLSIIDTGVGMEEETARRAVEPFYSTKGVGKGTGLGLSMVHGLALQLGGSMSIASRPGHGTRIDLLLPVSGQMPAPSTSPLDSTPGRFKGRVLLVDDEPLVRMVTADMLQTLGYDTTEVSSAHHAEARLAQGEQFDLVVTDHLMPGMTGAELAVMIRTRWPHIRVLIVSGYADVDGISADIPRLTKPFRESDLARALALAGG